MNVVRFAVVIGFGFGVSGCDNPHIRHHQALTVKADVVEKILVGGPKKAGRIRVEVASSEHPVTVHVYLEKNAPLDDGSSEGEPLASKETTHEVKFEMEVPANEKILILIRAAKTTSVSLKAVSF